MVQIDAMTINTRPRKRAKQRVMADLRDLLAFPAEGFEGPFRADVRLLISRLERVSSLPPVVPQLITWRGSIGGVELDVVEEDVERSRKVYCDHCRIVGWSGNPVCSKRYHFIIRNYESPVYRQTCTHCGTIQHWSEIRCTSCSHELKVSLENWAYLHLEDTNHLLHGAVHSNGYGHLLRINGREGGSSLLTGCNLMEFWDGLCRLLHVRKVTVMDVSKKYGMDYRLLHAVMKGYPWYGNWGYQFGAGSFATSITDYEAAVNILSNIPLSVFRSQPTHNQLRNIIALYLSLSDCKLETLSDLFCFLAHLLKGNSEKNEVKECYKEKIEDKVPAQCLWKEDDVQQAINSLVRILRAVTKSKWVTSRALRGATFLSIGSPELLDYCLRTLDGVSTSDGLTIEARCNSETNSIEYRLQSASDKAASAQNFSRPSREHLLHDLKFLYDSLLNPATMQSCYPQSLQQSARSSALKLLDCKHFIKHYDNAKEFLQANPFSLVIWCSLELSDRPKDYVILPPELLTLPTTATIADLKFEATKAFQETYLIFHEFLAEQVLFNSEVINEATQISSVLDATNFAVLRGMSFKGQWAFQQFRMERGTEDWTVNCMCGSKDDDGERMLACDSCGIWQHTRCAGIEDFQEVPETFVCRLCSMNAPMCRGKGGIMYRDGITIGRCQVRDTPLTHGTNSTKVFDINCV